MSEETAGVEEVPDKLKGTTHRVRGGEGKKSTVTETAPHEEGKKKHVGP